MKVKRLDSETVEGMSAVSITSFALAKQVRKNEHTHTHDMP